MRIDEIDELIVRKEDFDDISGIDYKKIKSKINNGKLNPDERDLVEKAQKLFGDDFFNLSESGRNARIDYVKQQNAKLSEIKTNIEDLATEIKNLEEKKARGETTVDGKNIDDVIKNKKKDLEKTRNSVSDLEKGAKTSDILKQTLSKWNSAWDFYKKGVEERYDHPVKYTLKRIALPTVTAFLGGWVLPVSVGVVAYFAARTLISQNRKAAGYKPNLDALKANFFTGKNSLKNALFRKKNVEKIIGKVKKINLEKVISKATVAPTTDPDKTEEDTKASSKSISLDKLIEQIKGIKVEDRNYSNIEDIRLLLKELEVRIGMGAIIPEDDKLKERISQMRKMVDNYDTLMGELNNAYSKKDDKSLDNMKLIDNVLEKIANETRDIPINDKNKFDELDHIIDEFAAGIAKTIDDAYVKLGDTSKENMEELSKFCDKIDNYMFAIKGDSLKEKVKEIKARVAEYKKNNASDNTISKLDELFDNKDEEKKETDNKDKSDKPKDDTNKKQNDTNSISFRVQYFIDSVNNLKENDFKGIEECYLLMEKLTTKEGSMVPKEVYERLKSVSEKWYSHAKRLQDNKANLGKAQFTQIIKEISSLMDNKDLNDEERRSKAIVLFQRMQSLLDKNDNLLNIASASDLKILNDAKNQFGFSTKQAKRMVPNKIDIVVKEILGRDGDLVGYYGHCTGTIDGKKINKDIPLASSWEDNKQYLYSVVCQEFPGFNGGKLHYSIEASTNGKTR